MHILIRFKVNNIITFNLDIILLAERLRPGYLGRLGAGAITLRI